MMHIEKNAEELGPSFILSAEHWLARAEAQVQAPGRALRLLVNNISQQRVPTQQCALMLDTNGARQGLLQVPITTEQELVRTSSKKEARPGDILVSRLRPYLLQIAPIPEGIERLIGDMPIYVSTEFYVLRSADQNEGIAYLLPWLLSRDVQAVLQSAATGGHHPRVSSDLLMNLQVPNAIFDNRKLANIEITEICLSYLEAQKKWGNILCHHEAKHGAGTH